MDLRQSLVALLDTVGPVSLQLHGNTISVLDVNGVSLGAVAVTGIPVSSDVAVETLGRLMDAIVAGWVPPSA